MNHLGLFARTIGYAILVALMIAFFAPGESKATDADRMASDDFAVFAAGVQALKQDRIKLLDLIREQDEAIQKLNKQIKRMQESEGKCA